MVRGVVRRTGISQSLTEDAVQATWLRLAVSIGSIRSPESLGGWLKTAAHNEAVNVIRKNWRLICSDTIDETLDDSPEASEIVAANSQLDLEATAVHAALNVLSDRQRIMVDLRYLEKEPLSYSEIAETLSVSLGAIGPTLGRALRRMEDHPSIQALR